MDNNDLTCSICLHDRKQPKILTCLHVYCCQCLLDYVNKSLQDGQFPCPLCREQIQLPSGGVEYFQDFFESDVENGSDDVVNTKAETDDVVNTKAETDDVVNTKAETDDVVNTKAETDDVVNTKAETDDVVNTKAETDDVSGITDVPPARTESLCDVCENKTILKFRCKDCKQSFCDSCKKPHDKFPFTQNHVVVDIDTGSDEVELLDDGNQDNSVSGTNLSSMDLCSEHPSKPIEIYCVECKKSVCVHCYVDETNRGVHNGHKILNLDDKITKTKLRIDLKCVSPKLQIQIDRLQKFSDDLKSKLSEIDIFSEEACTKVDQQVQIISKLIQSRAEQIKTQVNRIRNKERNKLENLKKEMEISINKLKSDIENSQITLDGESVVKIVARRDINRNDEMEVKKKDLFLPNFEFPSFIPRTDVRGEIEGLFGECHNLKQQTFTLDFNLPRICSYNHKSKRYFDFKEFEWYVSASCNDNYLGVYLQLVKLKTGKKMQMKVEYSITFLNKLAGDSLTKPQITYLFYTGDNGYGYGNAITLDELKDPKKGFVNEDGNFTIRISIQELKSMLPAQLPPQLPTRTVSFAGWKG